MKLRVLPILLVLSVTSVSAQITITSSDLPSAGDTFRVSNGFIDPSIDPVPTGANFTWDFSALQWVTQQVDTFLSVSSTGITYSVVFANLPFNNYRANQAVVGPDLPSLPQITITDVYYFYYNGSGAYDLKGYGARINGIQTPLPFNNLDRILDFPVNYGNAPDSSDSDYNITIPTLGGYFHQQHRVNEIDGWGTLITPYGTFNTLRVKSVIAAHDSLALSLGGFGFDLPLTTEYKWYGTNQGIPLLQINTTSTFGNEVVSSIVYRDSVRVLPTGIQDLTNSNSFTTVLYPNPAVDGFSLNIHTQQSAKAKVTLTDLAGRKVIDLFDGVLATGGNQLFFPLSTVRAGVYLVQTETQGQTFREKLVVQ